MLDRSLCVGFNFPRIEWQASRPPPPEGSDLKKILLALCAFVFLAAVQAKAEDNPAADKGDMKMDGKKMDSEKIKKKGKKMKKGMKDMDHKTQDAPPAK